MVNREDMICDKNQRERKKHWFQYAMIGEAKNSRVEQPFIMASKKSDSSPVNIPFYFLIYKSRFHREVLKGLKMLLVRLIWG